MSREGGTSGRGESGLPEGSETDDIETGADEAREEIGEEFERPPDVPRWDDEYLDEVAERLLFNYDLERDYRIEGERFDLYGRMEVHSEKHFFHPALSFAQHRFDEHLFARRVGRLSVEDIDRLVELGHRLSEEWIAPDEEHYSTDFTFVTIAPELPGKVIDRIDGFRERTLLKYGYHGHYEINLVAVAPEREELVASEEADVARAFGVWESIERAEPGLLGLLARRLQL